MKSFRYLTALGLSLGLFTTPAAEAVLISVKSLGMAGIGYGYAQDAMAAAHNPGSAAVIDNRLDFGGTYIHCKGSASFEGNLVPGVNGSFNSYARAKDFFSPNFGVNYNVDENWTVGVVAYNRDTAKTTYKNPFILLGTTKAGLEYLHQTISPYIAYRWGCHSFGVSVNWDIQRAKVNGFQNFDNALFSEDPGHVTNRGYNWSNGVGFTFGYYGQITDTLSVGVSYQPETQMSRFKKYSGFLAHGGKFNIPEKIGAGFSWRFLECATFAFDYEHVHWKQVKAVANDLLGDLGLNQLGSNDGPGFGWTDKNFYRFGLDYAWSEELIVRCGWRYAPTQIRRSQTVLNGFIMEPLVEHFATIGATYYLSCRNEIDFFAGYGLQKKLRGRNSIPAGFGGGECNLKQDLWALGLSWGHKF